MLSSRLYPTSFFFLVVVLSRAVGQEKNSEFKHELPEGVELVDPKSLGLTDADLSKFLGNVKVLGGGQVGDTKTQILSVGFEGDENINFNDFHIPGLTDGNKTALPEKDKEIADIAFKRFKEFFQDPKKARQYDDKNNIQFPPPKGFEHFKNTPQAPQNNVQGRFQQQHPPHFQIPMIQKPYTTPRTEIRQHFTQNQRPPHPQQQHHQQHHQQQHHHQHHQQQHPPQHHHQQPPPPPQPHKQYITPFNQAQIQQQQQQVYHSQKPQPQSSNLEFGARIPVSPNPHLRPQQSQPVPQQHQHHQQNQGQFQFHRQHEQQRQHRLTIQQNHRHQQHQNHHQPQPQQQQQQQHNFQAPPPQQHAINHSPPQHHPSPQNYPEPNPPQLVPPPPPPPRPQQQHNQNQNFVQHSQPQPSRPHQHIQNQNFVAHPQPPPTRPQQHTQSQNVVPHSQPPPPPPSPQPQEEFPASREQGRVVRNQLLQLNNNHIETSNNHAKLHSPSASTYHTTTNHLPAHSHQHASFQQPPQGTATSHVYIQHGPKAKSIEHTSFHPKFQPPTRFAKDFTPLPPQATTARPHFEVTPSMALIPLSTNENAIKDPARTMQLRHYQRERALASNAHQSQAVLPLQAQAAPPTTPTTTPISITTSYPETHHQEDQQHQFSPTNYHSGSQQLQQRPLNPKFTSNDNDNAISENDDFSKSQQQFSFQKQQQQHQLHLLQQRPPQQTQAQQQQQFHRPTQPAQTQPPVFYTQQHNSRPPRQGHGQGPPPPRFQFHVQHDLGRPPRFQMQPDPKGVLNTIRRKRGYRRLSNLFRMFRSRWDNRN